MPWINSNTCEIYFEDVGSGPTILFVSGYFGVADIWQEQIARLRKDFRCISLDSRGYGRSGPSEMPLSAELHASDLKAVLDAASVTGKVLLVTHSMGGNTASSFALTHPDRVAGIVYTGTYLSGPQLRELGVSAAALIENVSTPSGAAAMFRSFGISDALAAEAAKWSLDTLTSNAHALEACDLGDRHREIAVPVVIVQGEKDVVTPPEPCATELVALLPNAKLQRVPGVNHFPQIGAPELVADMIRNHAETCLV